jgi:hypothetical protein
MTSLLRAAGKRINREQERLKQRGEGNGEEDPLKDAIAVFDQQQSHADRLLREAQKYMKAMQAATDAAERFREAVCTVYDPDWEGAEPVMTSLNGLNLVGREWPKDFRDQVIAPLLAFTAKFPPIKERINKRQRRHLDFGIARRAHESGKEKASPRLAQLEKERVDAEALYKSIDDEMHQTIPAFNSSRKGIYGCLLQAHYKSQAQYNKNCREIYLRLGEHMDILASSASLLISQPITSRRHTAPATKLVFQGRPRSGLDSSSQTDTTDNNPCTGQGRGDAGNTRSSELGDGSVATRQCGTTTSSSTASSTVPSTSTSSASLKGASLQAVARADAAEPRENAYPKASTVAPAADTPSSHQTRTDGLPSGSAVAALKSSLFAKNDSSPVVTAAEPEVVAVIFDVIELRVCLYNYFAQDEDELSFRRGDVIERIRFANSDDEDDGWFNGRLGSRVGLFPANFTTLK